MYYDADAQICVGYHDVRDDEFWVRGHIPGRPVFPGVLMCESSAQLCSYYYKRASGREGFLGFAGLQDVKFRGQVVPGDRFVILSHLTEANSRRILSDVQGVVNGKLVFQGVVIGMFI